MFQTNLEYPVVDVVEVAPYYGGVSGVIHIISDTIDSKVEEYFKKFRDYRRKYRKASKNWPAVKIGEPWREYILDKNENDSKV